MHHAARPPATVRLTDNKRTAPTMAAVRLLASASMTSVCVGASSMPPGPLLPGESVSRRPLLPPSHHSHPRVRNFDVKFEGIYRASPKLCQSLRRCDRQGGSNTRISRPRRRGTWHHERFHVRCGLLCVSSLLATVTAALRRVDLLSLMRCSRIVDGSSADVASSRPPCPFTSVPASKRRPTWWCPVPTASWRCGRRSCLPT